MLKISFCNKEFLLKQASGRILGIDLRTKKMWVHATGLAFPNGIVFYDEQLYIAQLAHYRIVKVPSKKGDYSAPYPILIDNLQGLPDNLKLVPNQHQVTIGFPIFRDTFLDFLDESPRLRKAFSYIAEKVIKLMANNYYAGGIIVDLRSGTIVKSLIGLGSKEVQFTTCIVSKNGKYYFGSYSNSNIVIVNEK